MKQRATIVLVFAVFLAPVVLATLMHSNWWHFQPETKHYGDLVEPVIALHDFQVEDSTGRQWQQADLLEHWTLLAVTDTSCTQECIERLTWLARLRETQGRHLQRLNVMVVGSDLAQLQAPPGQPGIILAQFEASDGRSDWRQQLPARFALNTTYLVDPAGNIILSYPPASDPTGIRKDLKRILTWSKADTA